MECKKGGGEGGSSYHGTTYKGFFNMKMVEDGQTMTMNMKLAGKYLGPCPKGQKWARPGRRRSRWPRGQEDGGQGKAAAGAAAGGAGGQREKGRGAHQAERGSGGGARRANSKGSGERRSARGRPAALNLKPGQDEITIERGSRFGTTYTPVEEERKTVCVTEDVPVPAALGAGRPANVKQGKEEDHLGRHGGGRTMKGGILYRELPRGRGDDRDGHRLRTAIPQRRAKLTGRRIGDGDRVGGRDYSAKGKTAHLARKKGGLRRRREQNIEGPGQGNPEPLRLLTVPGGTRCGGMAPWALSRDRRFCVLGRSGGAR